MELNLTGRRVLVTGGTRGIGRTTVLALAAGGARVVACYRRAEEPAELLRKELAGFGDGHLVQRCDVTQPAEVQALAQTCRQALGGLDVLVNNAGVDGHRPLSELALTEWNEVLRANLTAAFLVTQACAPLLADGASVVNLGASLAQRGMAGRAHYTAAKAGLVGLARSLCKELGPRGIRVNNVAPGVVVTDGDGPPAPVAERIRAMTALGRLGTAEDVAAAVVYLASDLSRYVSGITLNVDGGM